MVVTNNLILFDKTLVLDPTERVTNGGFETGNKSGWSGSSFSVASSGAYQGKYYLDVVGSGGYTTLTQNVNYTGTTSVSNAGAVPVVNYYDIPMSDIAVSGWNWLVNIPGQYVQNWTMRSTTPGLTGSGTIVIWTYSSTHGHVDSVSVTVPDARSLISPAHRPADTGRKGGPEGVAWVHFVRQRFRT